MWHDSHCIITKCKGCGRNRRAVFALASAIAFRMQASVTDAILGAVDSHTKNISHLCSEESSKVKQSPPKRPRKFDCRKSLLENEDVSFCRLPFQSRVQEKTKVCVVQN